MKKGLLLLCMLPAALPVQSMTLNGLSAGYDYTDYSASHGSKKVAFAELKSGFDRGAAVVNVARGERDYGQGKSFTGTRGRTTVWYDWDPLLSTRTGISLGDNSPVFVRQEVLNDFNLKLVKGTVLTLGGRHARYYNDTEVNAWSAGGTFYVGPFITTYRYTRYDTAGVGNSDSHLMSIRLKDAKGEGYTQLFASSGTGAYTYDWTPETRNGKLHSLSLKRTQPLTTMLTLDIVVGRQWYDTPVSNYNSIGIQSGLTWRF